MDYTVEFDSELLKQFPQEEHFMYKRSNFPQSDRVFGA